MLSNIGIDQSGNHALFYTLQQIYNSLENQNQMFVLYNDEKPDSSTTNYYGHTKGAINFDINSGYWLIHSVPKFPPKFSGTEPSQYSYPTSGQVYGQTMFCVSYSIKQLNDIGNQLLYTSPWIYSSYISKNISSIAPAISMVIKSHIHVSEAPWWKFIELESLSGIKMKSFAKHREYGADLYDNLVAPDLKQNLFVETWQHGRNNMPSNCSIKYKVKNIKRININGLSFPKTDDHSKWCIGDNYTLCIGDINRQYSQEYRSGGTLCIQDQQAYNNFDSLIEEWEMCP